MRNCRRHLPWVLTGAALLAVVALWFTPHYDAWALKRAADANDLPAFAARVDLAAVRESLKASRREGARGGGRFGRLAARSKRLLFGAFTDRMVDRLVTHERLARAIRGEPPREADRGGQRDLRTRLRYESLNRFAVEVRDPADPEAPPVALVFARHGLADWRLSAVRL